MKTVLKWPAQCLVFLAALPGCGGEGCLPVEGRVTLDRRPLAGALVWFIPENEEAAQPASAVTGADGRYILEYSDGRPGAPAGKYRVRITTARAGNPEADPPVAAVPERVPARYNLRTELVVDVPGGEAAYDFALDSSGEIVQPRAS